MIHPTQYPLLVCLVSFVVLWSAALAGSRFTQKLEDVRDGFGIILTATLTLLGLILGFAFSMAITRYDQRKLYEEEEANAIGTEFARAELLPAVDRDNVQTLLRQYLDARIRFYQTRDRVRFLEVDTTTSRLQSRLWEGVRNPAAVNQSPVMALVVSGMNDVLNSQGYTQAAWRNEIPIEAWILLEMIATSASVMVGLSLRRVRSHGILVAAFPAIVAVSFFLIADIESPRRGLIHIMPVNLMDVARAVRISHDSSAPVADRPGSHITPSISSRVRKSDLDLRGRVSPSIAR